MGRKNLRQGVMRQGKCWGEEVGKEARRKKGEGGREGGKQDLFSNKG